MKGKLTKVTGGNNIRTDEVIGSFAAMPAIGKPFIMVNNDPIEKNMGQDTRLVVTSMVKKVDSSKAGERIVVFTTLNSIYQLEVEEVANPDENTSAGK